MESLTDEELVERYRAEPDSRRGGPYLDHLFRRHHRRVAAWCLRMTGDVDSAADMAQEVFLRAYQRLPSFRGDARFTTWLYAIARNHCIDELRSRAARAEDLTDSSMEDLADHRSEDISSAMERRELEYLMKLLIREALDETETQVITMHYVQELPLDAITRVLRLDNQSGAKAYIVSARRKLNRALARWKGRNERIQGTGHGGS